MLARIGPDLHRRLATFAQRRKESINAVITQAVENRIGPQVSHGHDVPTGREAETSGGHGVPRPRKAKGA